MGESLITIEIRPKQARTAPRHSRSQPRVCESATRRWLLANRARFGRSGRLPLSTLGGREGEWDGSAALSLLGGLG